MKTICINKACLKKVYHCDYDFIPGSAIDIEFWCNFCGASWKEFYKYEATEIKKPEEDR